MHRLCTRKLLRAATFNAHVNSSSISLPVGSLATGTRYQHASTATPRRQSSVPASYYRGGTSRALMFHRDSLPQDESQWPAIFKAALGSPDPHGRQLNGMGGGISSLSKICVVSKSKRKDADVDFTFAAVSIKEDDVDMSGNCGNMSSAIGPFAINDQIVNIADIVQPQQGSAKERPDQANDQNLIERDVTVRIHNTNTSKNIHATFPVLISSSDDFAEAQTAGNFTIDGVAGTAAKVKLDFRDPAGSKTGKLLPTGSVIDVVHGKEATCVDVGNPAIFVRAEDFGVGGAISPDAATEHPSLLAELDKVRRTAAVKMGVGASEDLVPASIPKICMVAPPAANRLSSGVDQAAEEVDVLVRAISVGQPHKAIPITMALAAAAAAKLQGSIVNECLSETPADGGGGVTIGHASGKIVVGSAFNEDGSLDAATVYRTATRLMKGQVYWG